ncbi:hypothetical protein LCGC14_0527050 [marine sediment metagenome]|uniref:Uncharacterized protein n=1 Tax=marine sediment metagenome TaxID=412755 RepID=A0A0F9UI44_9ZZZZ
MGWSIDLIRPGLDTIFGNLKKQYTVQHVEATNPTVMVKHEGEITLSIMKRIVGMFPEFVYMNFVPNSTFPTGQSIAETH